MAAIMLKPCFFSDLRHPSRLAVKVASTCVGKLYPVVIVGRLNSQIFT
jgi:hypothetical protein